MVLDTARNTLALSISAFSRSRRARRLAVVTRHAWQATATNLAVWGWMVKNDSTALTIAAAPVSTLFVATRSNPRIVAGVRIILAVPTSAHARAWPRTRRTFAINICVKCTRKGHVTKQPQLRAIAQPMQITGDVKWTTATVLVNASAHVTEQCTTIAQTVS